MNNVVNLVSKEWEGKTFTFRDDGYFNMTKAAKQFGKQLQHFWNSPETENYLLEITRVYGLSSDSDDKNSVKYVKKGNGSLPGVGTWGHPKLAVFFARWLDVRFAVACRS